MNYLVVLHETIRGILDSGRIGTPVFVRWTACIAEDKDVLKAQLAEMTYYTGRWLSAKLRRLYVTGTESQGHLSLALDTVGGGSALLALTLAHNRPHISIALYGNQGALYHNELIDPLRDGSLALQSSSPAEDAFVQQQSIVLDAIEQSLAQQQPIDLTI